jgi:hypothetical protein
MKAAAWALGAHRTRGETVSFPPLPEPIRLVLRRAEPPISEETLDELASTLAVEFRRFAQNLPATAARLNFLKHWSQRAVLARALTMLPGPSNPETRLSRDFIARKLLDDPDPAVRYEAATALVCTSPKDALPALRDRLAAEAETTVRTHLVELIEELT